MSRELYLQQFGATAKDQAATIARYMREHHKSPRPIYVVSHPFLGFRNVDNIRTHDGMRIARHVAIGTRGHFSYLWKNPGEKTARRKLAFFQRIDYRDSQGRVHPDLRWVVTTAAYEDEAYAGIANLRRTLYVISAILTLLFLASMYLAMKLTLIRPLDRLLAGVRRVDEGDLEEAGFTEVLTGAPGDKAAGLYMRKTQAVRARGR